MLPTQFNLRIVPIDQVILHEGIEPDRVGRLITELKADGVLKHPPIVTEVETLEGQPRYMVLDGATRLTALRALGCRDLLVQIVDYISTEIGLETWHHLLRGIESDKLVECIRQIGGVELLKMNSFDANALLEERAILSYLVLPDRMVWGIKGEGDCLTRMRALNRVVDVYRGHSQFYRVATTSIEALAVEYPDWAALMVFPSYSPVEVLHFALSDCKLPTGITCHLIAGRVLNVNVSLKVLASDKPLEQKNEWLDHWMTNRVDAQKVRFYGEPVFVFEE